MQCMYLRHNLIILIDPIPMSNNSMYQRSSQMGIGKCQYFSVFPWKAYFYLKTLLPRFSFKSFKEIIYKLLYVVIDDEFYASGNFLALLCCI